MGRKGLGKGVESLRDRENSMSKGGNAMRHSEGPSGSLQQGFMVVRGWARSWR